jgi:hypothetical protein
MLAHPTDGPDGTLLIRLGRRDVGLINKPPEPVVIASVDQPPVKLSNQRGHRIGNVADH